jgi:hypothetical protein
MVFSSLYSMVGRNSIMAHCDAELKGGGDHLIGAGRDPFVQIVAAFLDSGLRRNDESSVFI